MHYQSSWTTRWGTPLKSLRANCIDVLQAWFHWRAGKPATASFAELCTSTLCVFVPVVEICFRELALAATVPRYIVLYDAGGRSGNNHTWLVNAFVHEGVGSHDAVISDIRSAVDDRAEANPHMVSDLDRGCRVQSLERGSVNDRMSVTRPDFDLSRKHAPLSNDEIAVFLTK